MRVTEGFANAMLVALTAIFAALCVAVPANAQEAINPKIVIQTLPYGGVEVAAWTLDDRHILTANATTRTLLIWNAETGIIVDRLILPSDNPEAALSVRRLTSIEMSEDGMAKRFMRHPATPTAWDEHFATRSTWRAGR